MPWVRLDDNFPDHPKVAAAGPLAGWVHVCGIAYCNRNLTDGFVPDGVALRLADFGEIQIDFGDYMDYATCAYAVQQLVAAKIWKRVTGGFQIHDFHDFQPSRDDVMREREQNRQRQQAYRNRRKEEKSNGDRNGNVTPLSQGPRTRPLPDLRTTALEKRKNSKTKREKDAERISVSDEIHALGQAIGVWEAS